MHTNDSFFVTADYREFKRRINRCPRPEIRRKSYETVIYDEEGDILGIFHAASIDEKGRCHPTAYYLRRANPPHATPRAVA